LLYGIWTVKKKRQVAPFFQDRSKSNLTNYRFLTYRYELRCVLAIGMWLSSLMVRSWHIKPFFTFYSIYCRKIARILLLRTIKSL